METLYLLMAGLTAIILFIFGLQNFSKEIQNLSGERFRKSLANATRIPLVGLGIGAIVTALIQSSSATSVIAISLVNAGVISFKNSVGIIFGANIGTTVTAQLVAFKLTNFAPLFIIFGFILSLARTRYAIFGKAIFYFGFVFFSLNLISSSLNPLQHNEELIKLLTQPQNPFYAILFGCLFTALVQSSSVTTGLAVIFTQQGILGLENAIPLIMGANIGTTATAIIAMFNMDIAAKKTALSHFLFNVGGVAIFMPFFLIYGDKLEQLQLPPAVALAVVHLLFNVATSILFIIFISPFTRLVDILLGEGTMDFERLAVPVHNKEDDFTVVKKKLEDELSNLLVFLQENYNAVALSVETNYPSVFETAGKRIEYLNFIKAEYLKYFSKAVTTAGSEEKSSELIRIINQFDYLFQIHDSINDLYHSKRILMEHYIELKSDILVLVRGITGNTLDLFDEINKSLATHQKIDLYTASSKVQLQLNSAHKDLLGLLADPTRRDAGTLTNFITYSQRLKDKLLNFYQLCQFKQEQAAAESAEAQTR